MAAMDDIPTDILRAAYERKPIYLLKVPLHMALWVGCTWLLYRTQNHPLSIPIGVACSIMITNLIRGLGAVAHDAVHGNCSRSKTLSYLLALVCWMPTLMSVTLYSNYHLHHHKIANTYADVDNFVVTDYTRNPLLAKLLLLLVYTIGYPVYFLTCMSRYVKRLTLAKRVRMYGELALIYGLLAFAWWKMPGQVFFYFYGIPFFLSAALASVTSMIEHYEMLPGDDAYTSRTYGTKAYITNFIWNNVSFHNEHHKFPGVPFYNLRRFHEAAYPYYDERVQAECYEGVWKIAFELYGRILKLDIAKLDERYRPIDKNAERQRLMAVPGIQAGVA